MNQRLSEDIATFHRSFGAIADDFEDFEPEIANLLDLSQAEYDDFLDHRAATEYGQLFARFRHFALTELIPAYVSGSVSDRAGILEAMGENFRARLELWSLIGEYRWRLQKARSGEHEELLRTLLKLAVLDERDLDQVATAHILTSVWGDAQDTGSIRPGTSRRRRSWLARRSCSTVRPPETCFSISSRTSTAGRRWRLTLSVSYEHPGGSVQTDPKLEELKHYIVDLPTEYWNSGSGNATLSHSNGALLLVLPNLQHGVYLKYFRDRNRTDDVWLSLADPHALDRGVGCGEEWYASVGLFLSPRLAWSAVSDFCETGGMSDQIEWTRPSAIPEGGNW